MAINKIQIRADGYIHCKSCFYSAFDVLSGDSGYTFSQGTNMLVGEIDSGSWAVSYLLSMFECRPKDFVMSEIPQIAVNGEPLPFHELAKFTCYMDRSFPLFSSMASVRLCVEKGLKSSGLTLCADDVKDLFCLDSQRFERPLAGVGNEIFRAMSAIAYCFGQQVFCFAWLSKSRFEGYHKNLSGALETLEVLNKTVIMPVGE